MLVIGAVDMLLNSHPWVVASSPSHPFMDLLRSFVHNPIINYECFLIIFVVTKIASKMYVLI